MFEDLLLFGIILIGNLIVWFIIRNLNLKRMSISGIIYRILGFIGILIHELSHFTMCLLTGVRPTDFRISYRGQRGSVSVPFMERLTFLQGFLLCFAPLLISSYIAYLCIYVMFLTGTLFVFKVFCGAVFISILMHCRSSSADLRVFKKSFLDDPLYSLYQVGLVVLSGIIVFLLNISVPYYLSFVNYILMGVFYTFFKYGFLGIRKIYDYFVIRVRGSSRVSSPPPNPYRVRRISKKPKRERIPRRQW